MCKNRKGSGGRAEEAGRVVGNEGRGVTEARSCRGLKAVVWNLGLTVSERESNWKVSSGPVISPDLGFKSFSL